MSVISLVELYQGVFYSANRQGDEQALQTFLQAVAIVTVDDETCRIFARERGRLKAAGNIISDFDLLIGSTVLRHNLTLLTNNRRHFRCMQGLNIISEQTTSGVP